MTREQLDAIRARLDGGFAPSTLDAALLLDEVERLTTELDEVDSDLQLAVQRLTAEVERLNAERDALQVGDTATTALEANERFAPSEYAVVYIEKWCDGSGPCAVELEPHGHWRLSRSVSLASVRKAERDAAFKRGVAAMREAAADAIDCPASDCPCNGKASAQSVLDVPDPEDK